ncbi:MAG: GspH/FimT family protein, partial [Lysobacter sp.]
VRIARVQTDLSETFLTSSRLAVASGAATIACPSRGDGCENSIDWSHGWLVFADVDGDRRFGPRDTLVKRFAAMAGGVRLHSTQGRPRVVFQADGDNAGSNVTFAVCAPRSGQAGVLVLSNAGRFRLDAATPAQRQSCASG